MADQTHLVQLVEVDRDNWRAVVDVTPNPDQEEFVAPVSRYLCLCHYEDDWNPLAIEAEGSIVGHVMWAVDEDEGSVWLGGLVIDAASQGKGFGRGAVLAFLDRFTDNGKINVALSYMQQNTIARNLYLDIGFVETGETAGDEVVARYQQS